MTPSARTSRLTEADRAEWLRYARDVRPLPGRALPPEAPSRPTPAEPAGLPRPPTVVRPDVRRRAAPRAALAIGVAPAGLDAATWQRFRTGRLAATRRLDLHGHTAERAHRSLRAFLLVAAADGVRCVEVITGRGSGAEGGVIRREVPFWLNLPDLRPLVLAAAHPHAANPGAVRLLLRRSR